MMLHWQSAGPATQMSGGLVWRVDRTTAAQEIPLLLTPEEVLDDHLKSPNTAYETAYVERAIRAAQEEAQRFTQLALGEQALVLVADGFPQSGDLILPFPPVTEVGDVTVIGADGVSDVWGGSPLPYQESLPTGRPGRIRPVSGGSWPSVSYDAMDAVRVGYTAGYSTETVPELIIRGMLLLIGELYKQRSESVHAFNQAPALVRARSLWSRLKVY